MGTQNGDIPHVSKSQRSLVVRFPSQRNTRMTNATPAGKTHPQLSMDRIEFGGVRQKLIEMHRKSVRGHSGVSYPLFGRRGCVPQFPSTLYEWLVARSRTSFRRRLRITSKWLR